MSQAEDQKQFVADLDVVLGDLRAMLIEKNASYGDSALNPVRIFSKVDASEQINVRIDDKLSRLARGHDFPGDNDRRDLMGYLALAEIVVLRKSESR